MPTPIQIACTIDDAYAQHCSVMLCSLLENNPQNEFDIYIIHGGLKQEIQQKLQTFLQKKYKQSLDFILINPEKVAGFPRKEEDHVSLATYYRFFLPNLLKDSLEKVLFLDPDMIIRSDIKPLWETVIDNYSLAAIENPNSHELKIMLSIPIISKYFNAGVLLINLKKWRQNKVTFELLTYLQKHRKILRFHDQDVLNAVLWNQCKILSPEWNLIENYDQYTPKIVHFIGTRKPWHLKSKHPYRAEYFHYLKKTPWKNYSPLWDYCVRISSNLCRSLKFHFLFYSLLCVVF